MGNSNQVSIKKLYEKMSTGENSFLPQIPDGVMLSEFERDVFYTLNFLRTQPGLMIWRLGKVRKKFKISRKKYKDRRKLLAFMAKNKEYLASPIQVDKDIYYACKYCNEKFAESDFKIGGVLLYLNKLYKNVKGFEHTSFEWKGTGEEFVMYIFLKEDFTSVEGINPFFSNSIQYFGCNFSKNTVRKSCFRLCWTCKPEPKDNTLATKGLI
ncbi:unnamed protein product [Moneuplotes crassus]|uniref:Uncharacterized protein n=1 Tax=Euplotes crassus TaxID=5936 RepID=A0AAD1XMJ8_EUPCR|nr:unnamed protein product [Moneuplotes crassus]